MIRDIFDYIFMETGPQDAGMHGYSMDGMEWSKGSYDFCNASKLQTSKIWIFLQTSLQVQ